MQMEDGHFKIQQKHLREGKKALAIRLNADAVWHQHVSFEKKGWKWVLCALPVLYI